MKALSWFSLASFLTGPGMPSPVSALTSGPTQPEVSSFQQFGASDMVDPFTGDFSFNVPLFELPGPAGGYPFNLVYNAGIEMGQESSWVGLGWNLNPGSVNRQMRGLPDDFGGDEEIRFERDQKENTTYGLDAGLSVEFVGKEMNKHAEWLKKIAEFKTKTGLSGPSSSQYSKFVPSGNAKFGLRHNSYQGWGMSFSLGGGYGLKTMKTSIDGGKVQMDAPTPAGLNLKGDLELDSQDGVSLNAGLMHKKGSLDLSASEGRLKLRSALSGGFKMEKKKYNFSFGGAMTLLSGFQGSIPSIGLPMKANNLGISLKVGGKAPTIFLSGSLSGYFSTSSLSKTAINQSVPAYGYFHTASATDGALRDINREKDFPVGPYSKNMGIPVATHDVYTVSGQGVSGAFRPSFSGLEVFGDPFVQSRAWGVNVGVDLGVGAMAKLGVTIGGNYSSSHSGLWKNDLVGANTGRNGLYRAHLKSFSGLTATMKTAAVGRLGEPVFLSLKDRDPDKGAARSGGDVFIKDAYSGELGYKDGSKGPSPAELATFDSGRGQAESLQMFSNKDCAALGGEFAASYYEQEGGTLVLKELDRGGAPGKQTGAMVSLSRDGMRHVYALPAYNNRQKEVTFSAARPAGGVYAQRVDIPGGAEFYKVPNTDEFLEAKEIPKYAHSHLLTAVLGPSYVDSDNTPGPSSGDRGYWVKFTYEKVFKGYRWREPFSQANYIEGEENDAADNKGAYVYGEKEIWYLKTAETNTHLAVFSTSDRLDGKEALEEKQNGDLTGAGSLKKLDAIYLFSKAALTGFGDPVADPSSQEPIKVAVFSYLGYENPHWGEKGADKIEAEKSEELCQKAPNAQGRGKLTLSSLAFKHGKNGRGLKTPYVFSYDGFNPDYSPGESDRWGAYQKYKNEEDRAYFPYTYQKGVSEPDRKKWASAWNLTGVGYPSGGGLEISYESDDYAWVQDAAAASMTKISGLGVFGSGEVAESSGIYKVFFELHEPAPPGPPEDAKRILDSYLGGLQSVYFNLKISGALDKDKNPAQWLRTSVYAAIAAGGRGLDENSKDGRGYYTQGYFTVKGVDRPVGKPYHPFEVAAWRHIEQKQPKTAEYMKSVSEASASQQTKVKTVKALANPGLFGGLSKFIRGKDGWYKSRGYGAKIDLNNSYARLYSASGRKYGGGYRVSEIRLSDNWAEGAAVYGQRYSYKAEDGRSSSGVAAYEPLYGGDEISMRRAEKIPEGGFLPKASDDRFFEYPVNESYFPAPLVGYSRVSVMSLASGSLAGLPEGGARFPDAPFGGTGEAVHEFYTARDFPVIINYTDLGKTPGMFGIPSGGERKSRKILKFDLIIPFVGNFSLDNQSYSQGYSVELNDMHGKPKSTAYYPHLKYEAGRDGGRGKAAISDKAVSSVRYAYKESKDTGLTSASGQPLPRRLSNAVPVMLPPLSQEGFRIDKENYLLGIDHEVFADARESGSFALSASVSLDVDLEPPFIPLPSGWPSVDISSSSLRTFVTNTIVRRSGILESVTATDGLSRVETRNHLWDALTGAPVLSSAGNKNGDPVYSFSLPAYYHHPGMGEAFWALNTVWGTPAFTASGKGAGLYESHGGWPSGLFEGDEFLFTPPSGKPVRARFLYAELPGTGTPRHVFRSEAPLAGGGYTAVLVRSGRRNLLGATAGTVNYLALEKDGSFSKKDPLEYLEWVISESKPREIKKELPARASN